MPLPVIAVPQFPNVPNLPGVPQLVRAAFGLPPNPVGNIAALNAQTQQQQAALWASAVGSPTWGVVNQATGQLAVEPDSIFALDYKDEWKIPDFQIQAGSFASYNKTIIPFETSVRMNMGGSLAERTEFIHSLDEIVGDTNLYSIFTPEKSYFDCNILRREMTRRSSEGAFFLEVDVFFRQILQVTAQYSISSANTTNAQSPAAKPSTSLGNVQSSSAVPDGAAATAASAVTQTPN